MDLVDVEVDGDTTTWTDVNDRNRIYGVSAVNEAGKSSRSRFVCAVGNGCRLPPTPVVKISSDSPLVPSGLRSGDRFRLIFLSSTQRNADPTDIYHYNKFVQDRAAAGHADIRAHSAGFRAVACTEAVDARDNTGTNGIGPRDLVAGGRQGGRQLRGLLRWLLGRGGHRQGRVGCGRHHSSFHQPICRLDWLRTRRNRSV